MCPNRLTLLFQYPLILFPTGIRELAVSPLLLAVGRAPELQERRDLYALERKALAFGDRDARELTEELHRVNNQAPANRVVETGVAGYLASFLIIGSGGATTQITRKTTQHYVVRWGVLTYLQGILCEPLHSGLAMGLL